MISTFSETVVVMCGAGIAGEIIKEDIVPKSGSTSAAIGSNIRNRRTFGEAETKFIFGTMSGSDTIKTGQLTFEKCELENKSSAVLLATTQNNSGKTC